MWVPTIRATSVTQDTAVDSLSAATTTMNSGVSPCPGVSRHPRSWLLPLLVGKPQVGQPFSHSLGSSADE